MWDEELRRTWENIYILLKSLKHNAMFHVSWVGTCISSTVRYMHGKHFPWWYQLKQMQVFILNCVQAKQCFIVRGFNMEKIIWKMTIFSQWNVYSKYHYKTCTKRVKYNFKTTDREESKSGINHHMWNHSMCSCFLVLWLCTVCVAM